MIIIEISAEAIHIIYSKIANMKTCWWTLSQGAMVQFSELSISRHYPCYYLLIIALPPPAITVLLFFSNLVINETRQTHTNAASCCFICSLCTAGIITQSFLTSTTRPSLLPQFYARDEYDEAEVVQVHPLGSLVLARFLRLQFRTDVLSIGNDTKCLRFEVLGCPTGEW